MFGHSFASRIPEGNTVFLKLTRYLFKNKVTLPYLIGHTKGKNILSLTPTFESLTLS